MDKTIPEDELDDLMYEDTRDAYTLGLLAYFKQKQEYEAAQQKLVSDD
jgi:hypothetical protein